MRLRLCRALFLILAGLIFFPPILQAQQKEMKVLRARMDTLTPRECEVFRLVVSGMLNKQIAFDLGTVEKTIKVHRARVMKKMGAQSLAGLVRFAEKLGIGSSAV